MVAEHVQCSEAGADCNAVLGRSCQRAQFCAYSAGCVLAVKYAFYQEQTYHRSVSKTAIMPDNVLTFRVTSPHI